MGYWLHFTLSRCSGVLFRIVQWLCFGLRSLTQILVLPRKSKEKRARKEAIAFPKLFQSALILTQQRDHSKSRKYQLKLRNMFIHSVTQVARKNNTEYSQQEWV